MGTQENTSQLVIYQTEEGSTKLELDGFLQLNDHDILNHAGKVSHQMAKQLVEQEYDKFHRQRQEHAALDTYRQGLDYLEKVAIFEKNSITRFFLMHNYHFSTTEI